MSLFQMRQPLLFNNRTHPNSKRKRSSFLSTNSLPLSSPDSNNTEIIPRIHTTSTQESRNFLKILTHQALTYQSSILLLLPPPRFTISFSKSLKPQAAYTSRSAIDRYSPSSNYKHSSIHPPQQTKNN